MNDFEELMTYEKQILYTPLSCGKNLLELSSYQNIVLWWFNDWSFHHFLINIDREENQESTEKSKKIRFTYYIRHLFRLIRFNFDYILKSLSFFIYITSKKNTQDHVKKDRKGLVLFTGEDIEWRPKFDIQSGKSKRQDQFFSPIIKLLKEKKYPLMSTYDIRFPYYTSFSIIVDKLWNCEILHIPFEIYYNYKIQSEHKKAIRHFKKLWAKIKVDPIFHQLIVSSWPKKNGDIFDELQYYFTSVFPHNIEQIGIAEEFNYGN